MRIKKVRGHRRRWKDIEHWISHHKNLDVSYLKTFNRDYAKVRVHPWSGISITTSVIPEPKGETKKRIVKGLVEIYCHWKRQLDETNKPYYLKIWLFAPRLSRSQVVCAIGDNIDFYENAFSIPENQKDIRLQEYGKLGPLLQEFIWESGLDEEHLDNSELDTPDQYPSLSDYEEAKVWFNKKLQKPHSTTILATPDDETIEVYSFLKGNVWLGHK